MTTTSSSSSLDCSCANTGAVPSNIAPPTMPSKASCFLLNTFSNRPLEIRLQKIPVARQLSNPRHSEMLPSLVFQLLTALLPPANSCSSRCSHRAVGLQPVPSHESPSGRILSECCAGRNSIFAVSMLQKCATWLERHSVMGNVWCPSHLNTRHKARPATGKGANEAGKYYRPHVSNRTGTKMAPGLWLRSTRRSENGDIPLGGTSVRY